MEPNTSIAILGCGNLGLCIAKGIVHAKITPASKVVLTRRNTSSLEHMKDAGYTITSDNVLAVKTAQVIIVAVTPAQLSGLLETIKDSLDPSKHIIISVISGPSIENIKSQVGKQIPVVRAMPNTAIAVCESMTCICGDPVDQVSLKVCEHIFSGMGTCITVNESQFIPATVLCSCGVAFFCRAIRAASQGGVEIGFHAEDAIKMAAQTAKGAATLLLSHSNHPEYEVDKVTTPMGCTIAGLNQMEHHGFSSAMIRGITTSAEKATSLYAKSEQK